METAIKANIGQRVQLHPATDRWMMGDRYGVIDGVGRNRDGRAPYLVKMDVSGHRIRVYPENLEILGE